MYATEHVGQLIQNTPKANSWTLRLLLTQLYDPTPEVCELAVRILEDACESSDILELVVEMQPTLDHLGEIGDPLLLKYVVTSSVVQACNTDDYKDSCRQRSDSGTCTRLTTLSGR
jgi:rapamycin-insensitive companion of mTOR